MSFALKDSAILLLRMRSAGSYPSNIAVGTPLACATRISLSIANLLANAGKSLGEIYDHYGPIFIIRQNISVDDSVKFQIVDKFREWATNTYSDVSTIDGVKIYLDNGSFLARPSNTEPLIRVVADGITKEAAEEILRKFTKKLQEIIERFT